MEKNKIESLEKSLGSKVIKAKEKELTAEQKLELERKELGIKNPSRKNRREYLKRAGLLKAKNRMIPFSEEWRDWYNKTKKEGLRIFNENKEAVKQQQIWYLEQIDKNKRKSYWNFFKLYENSKKNIKNKVDKEIEKWYLNNKTFNKLQK